MHNIILCMGDQYKQRERIIRTKKKQKSENLVNNPRFTYSPSKDKNIKKTGPVDDSNWPRYRKNTKNSRLKKREKSPKALPSDPPKPTNSGYNKAHKTK